MVRDEHGNTLRVEGARIVIFKDGIEFLSQTIQPDDQADRNYQIRLRMDMQRTGTVSYTSLANSTGTPFTIGVVLNNVVYYPIEMTTDTHTIGKPGERIRLDLTLGVDSDDDGIPDAWEESQLYAGGAQPDDDGWDFSLIDRDGDFDRDGRSNWDEYIAGTYATDPTDYLTLQITYKFPNSVRLGFYGIYGKTYSLESSSDLKTWTPTSIYRSNPADPDGNSATVGETDNDNDPEADETESELLYDYATDAYDADHPPDSQSSLLAEDSTYFPIYAPATSEQTYYRLKVR